MAVAGRVLVCDDEELVRWSLAEGLRSQGFEVLEAPNGKVCLDLFEEFSPAALLIDVRMPEMDGLTCLRRLRETNHPGQSCREPDQQQRRHHGTDLLQRQQ